MALQPRRRMAARGTGTLLALGLLLTAVGASAQREPVDYADPLIGTSNSRWMLGPYAGVPFGMVQLGPDNQTSGWMSGYEYSIANVTGFSHLHAWTMGGLMLMPSTGDLAIEDGTVDRPYRGAGAGYHSRILKETEEASPGYYAVHLYDPDVFAEMTASTRCGFSPLHLLRSGRGAGPDRPRLPVRVPVPRPGRGDPEGRTRGARGLRPVPHQRVGRVHPALRDPVQPPLPRAGRLGRR